MKSKKPNKITIRLQQPRILVGIFLVVVVGFVGLLYAAMLNQQKRSQLSEILTTQTVETTPAPDLSPTASPLPEIVDEVKNGIYTNYTYGFSFEYDDEKFKTAEQFENANFSAKWAYFDGEKYIYLNISVVEPWDGTMYTANSSKLYRDIYEAVPNETIEHRHATFTKISSSETNGVKQSIYIGRTKPDAQTEHSVSFSAAWILQNDYIIELDMFTDPAKYEAFLQENKYLFDRTIESFELFE